MGSLVGVLPVSIFYAERLVGETLSSDAWEMVAPTLHPGLNTPPQHTSIYFALKSVI